jgi:hypothetical protein
MIFIETEQLSSCHVLLNKFVQAATALMYIRYYIYWTVLVLFGRLCGLVVRLPGYRTEMY